MRLHEKRLQLVQLTQHQQQVLAQIFTSTPEVAVSQTSGDANLVAAREALIRLGLVTGSTDEGFTVTESGKQVMVNHGLLDDGDVLTSAGEQALVGDQEPQQESVSVCTLLPAINEAANVRQQDFTEEDLEFLVLVSQDQAELNDNPELFDKLYATYHQKMPHGTQTGEDEMADVWMYDNMGMIINDIENVGVRSNVQEAGTRVYPILGGHS